MIQIDLDKRKWTEVMDGQWKLYPIKPVVSQYNDLILDMCTTLFTIQVTRAELDDFQLGRAIPSCVLEAHPLVKPIPRLLHVITLIGVKPPYNQLIIILQPSHSYLRRGTIAVFSTSIVHVSFFVPSFSCGIN